MRLNSWTSEEMDYLRANFPTGDFADMCRVLGRNKAAIKSMADKHKIRRAVNVKHHWTDAENELMRKEYPRGDLHALAEKLNKTVTAIYNRARFVGVERDPDLVAESNRVSGKRLADKNLGRRFVKGQVPANKGKKQVDFISPEKMKSVKANYFPKGNRPHNYKPVGYERTTRDGYIEVKVKDCEKSKDNFVLKQRLVYEQNFGPIPEGCVVEFIDGDKSNFDPANLVAKTRRQNIIDNGLRDTAIVKRQLKVKDPDAVQDIIENHSHLISLARASLKVNRIINGQKKRT
jgi:hypothetical protein